MYMLQEVDGVDFNELFAEFEWDLTPSQQAKLARLKALKSEEEGNQVKVNRYAWIEVPVPAYFYEFLGDQFHHDPQGREMLLSLVVAVGMSMFEDDVVQVLEPGHVRFRKAEFTKVVAFAGAEVTRSRAAISGAKEGRGFDPPLCLVQEDWQSASRNSFIT